MVTINTEYKSKLDGRVVEVVAMNEIKPEYIYYKMVNKHKPHRVAPLVEYIDSGVWKIMDLEQFLNEYIDLRDI